MGKAEVTYIMKMSETRRTKVFDDLFSYTIPALVLARNMECPPECLENARNHGRTLLRTTEKTADFVRRTMEYLSKELAPCITRHGVLLDIYGEGVMITGDSGVGKSEAAIELIMRGHRLVADDAVEIRCIADRLIGTAPEVIRNYIELRGIGVIDVRQLFGMRAVMPESQIDLVVEFEPWNNEKFYDRLGIEDRFIDILGKQVACVTVPIRPGRNLASIVEVAAHEQPPPPVRYNAAEELARRSICGRIWEVRQHRKSSDVRCSSLNIGIDVGGTNLRAGIVDESARLLSQEQIPVGILKARRHLSASWQL